MIRYSDVSPVRNLPKWPSVQPVVTRLVWWSSTGLLIFCVLGSRVFSANMSCKIFIALPFVVLNHFLNRSADGRFRRIEHQCAFGQPPDQPPYLAQHQFAPHCLPSEARDLVRLCSCQRRRSIGFGGATQKPSILNCPRRSSASELNTQALDLTDGGSISPSIAL